MPKTHSERGWPARRRSAADARDESRRLSYLFDIHQKDQRYAFRLADFLLDKAADVDFNHESSDPLVSLVKFEQSVKRVKNLVLICGQVGPAWLVGRIKKAFKAVCEQFETEELLRLEHIWLFLAPSSSGKPDLPAFPPSIKINVLDNSRSTACGKRSKMPGSSKGPAKRVRRR